MIPWPESVVESLARRTCVIYLGSGISHNSINKDDKRPPTWKTFLESGCGKLTGDSKSLIENKIKNNDYLMACELLRKALGKDEFNDLLKNEFQKPCYPEAEIHKRIFELDSKIVVTPNFDKIYDTYAQNATHGAMVIKNYADNGIIDCIRNSERLILKIHGTIDNPDKLVFSQVDYAKARNEHRHFYQILNALLLTQTFSFVGAGLNDPDIKLLLENYAFQYPMSRKHIFVIPDDQMSDDERFIHSETLGLDFLLYNCHDNHKELTDSIIDLVEKVANLRDEMGVSQTW